MSDAQPVLALDDVVGGDASIPKIDEQEEGFSQLPRWVMFLARIVLIGTSFGLQFVELGLGNLAAQHVLYGLSGVSILICFMLGVPPRMHWRYVLYLVWFLLAAIISTILSPYRAAVMSFVPKILLYVLFGGACGMVVSNSHRSLRKLTNLLIFSALISSLIAVIQARFGLLYFLARTERVMMKAVEGGRAYGFFANPNTFANFMLIPTAVIVAKLAYAPMKGSKAWRWPLLLLFTSVVIFSSSRSGVAALVVVSILAIGWRAMRPRMWGAIVVAVLAGTGLAWAISPGFLAAMVDRVFGGFLQDESRRHLLAMAFQLFGEHPVTGAGLFGFFASSGGTAAHNGFIEPFAELGIIGGSCVQLALFGAIWSLWRCVRLTRDTDDAWLYRGWFAGYTGLLLSAYLHGSGWRSSFIWAMAGIAYVSAMRLQVTFRNTMGAAETTELQPEGT